MLQMMLGLSTAVLCAAAASCVGPANGSSAPDASLAGVIAAVEPSPTVTRVTIDVTPGTGEPERAVLLVSPDTEVEVQRADGTTGRGGTADLVVGARIRAQYTGVEMRSLPPQYHATRIRVFAGP